MKLIRTFEITSDEFYDYLENQLLEEIQKTTKKKINKRVIKKGYFYENKTAKCKITIDEYKRGSVYQATVHSQTSFVRITYHTQETKEGLQIEFEQFVSGQDDELDKKNFVSRQFHNWITFGRMSHTLYDMRTDILNKREGIETPKMPQQQQHEKLKSFLQKKYGEQE